jgi:DNA recombination protein RmuC
MDAAIVIAGVLVGAVLGVAIGILIGRQGSAGLRAKLAAQEAAFGDRLNTAVLEASRQVSEDLAARNAADAEARLAAQRATLEKVVGPVGTKLSELAETVKQAEESRIKADTSVENKLAAVTEATVDLTKNTGQLTNALSGTQTRGKWGEFQLERMIEVAGLTERITWIPQAQEGSGQGALRPDLLVHIPEQRVLVVDAKAPALAFEVEGATEETDKAYATRLRNHIKALAKKDYIEAVPGAVGFVFLFLPSEAAYAGALRADPEILAFAAEHRVAVVAPSTLLSALTVVESIWRQFDANEHLEDAVSKARELHKRLMVFADRLGKVGERLGQAVDAYNTAVGSLEGSVYPAARRMEAANLAPNQAVLTVAPVDADDVRELKSSVPEPHALSLPDEPSEDARD